MNSAFSWLADELASLDAQHLRRARRSVRPLPGGWCEVDGRKLRNFSGNDYLDLAHDPRLAAAAAAALEEAGTGARASPLVCGRGEWQARLENELARFEGTAAAVLFPTGYAANLGAIGALVESGDVVIGDRLNHASLVDGCRLSGATFRVYAHGDADALERELTKHAAARRKLIVTDGMFSMDGDLAPLPRLRDVAERHGAMLLVDEAHATGVCGNSGRGACEELGVEAGPLRVGTLSKALGCQGGFVAGSQALIDWLWNRARTQMFSTALAPPLCAAAGAALEIVQREPELRTELRARAASFREMLRERGLIPLEGSVGPIVPLLIGEAARAMEISGQLEERGFLVGAIRPPTVPRGTSRLRISMSLAHDLGDLEALAEAIRKVLRTGD